MARIETRGSFADLNREITITGGGLAGLALASGLRNHGVPVTVIEAGSYPRHRVCGELISGVSEDTLESLGISSVFVDALRHRTIAWFEDERLIHRDRLKQPALGISRHCLDERLVGHVLDSGVSVRTGTRATMPDTAEGNVWAAGRRPGNGPWMGLKMHVRGIPMDADLEMHSGSNGYAGLAGVEDGWINVCGLFRIDRRIRTHPQQMLAAYLAAGGLQRLAERVRTAEIREGSVCAVAGFQLGKQKAIPGVFTLGDAESMIPPFTGNGMSMAFQSAELAVQPLVDWSRDELTWQQARNRAAFSMRRHFRSRLAVAQAVHPLLFRSTGRGCIRSLASAGALPFQTLLSSVR